MDEFLGLHWVYFDPRVVSSFIQEVVDCLDVVGVDYFVDFPDFRGEDIFEGDCLGLLDGEELVGSGI